MVGENWTCAWQVPSGAIVWFEQVSLVIEYSGYPVPLMLAVPTWVENPRRCSGW